MKHYVLVEISDDDPEKALHGVSKVRQALIDVERLWGLKLAHVPVRQDRKYAMYSDRRLPYKELEAIFDLAMGRTSDTGA